jgi:hypothetical protein
MSPIAVVNDRMSEPAVDQLDRCASSNEWAVHEWTVQDLNHGPSSWRAASLLRESVHAQETPEEVHDRDIRMALDRLGDRLRLRGMVGKLVGRRHGSKQASL